MRKFLLYFLFFFTNVHVLSSYAQQPSEGNSAQKSPSGLSHNLLAVVREDFLSDRCAEPEDTFEHVVEGEREELGEKMSNYCKEFMGKTTREKEGQKKHVSPSNNQTKNSEIGIKTTQTEVKKESEKEEQNRTQKKDKKTASKKPKKKEVPDDKILFVGTLLANPSQNIPANQFLFEPMLFFANTYGFYDAHRNLLKENGFFQYQFLANLRFGLTRNLDFNFITSVIQTHVSHIEVLTTGDTVISLGLQLMREKVKSCRPDIRLTIGENFPTGKFDLLDFNLNGGDAAGIGSFETIIGLSVAKTVPIGKRHSIRLNPNLTFFIPSSVEALGRSIFGGAVGIKGKAYPGNKFAVDLPFEYNITNSLIFGLDIFYLYNEATFFEHKTDFFQIELPASENFSLAPCFEYNPCEKFGLQAAIWFSVSGRNSLAFTTAALVGWWVF